MSRFDPDDLKPVLMALGCFALGFAAIRVAWNSWKYPNSKTWLRITDEQRRLGHPGCLIVAWAMIGVLVAVVGSLLIVAVFLQ